MADIAGIREATVERVRRHHERRREGKRCLTIEIHDREIDALVRHGLLETDQRNDTRAILAALREYLGNTLFLE
jgi:hypothetical protein